MCARGPGSTVLLLPPHPYPRAPQLPDNPLPSLACTPFPQLSDSATLADVALAAALAPLFGGALGRPAQERFGPVVAWLGRCLGEAAFEKALGGWPWECMQGVGCRVRGVECRWVGCGVWGLEGGWRAWPLGETAFKKALGGRDVKWGARCEWRVPKGAQRSPKGARGARRATEGKRLSSRFVVAPSGQQHTQGAFPPTVGRSRRRKEGRD